MWRKSPKSTVMCSELKCGEVRWSLVKLGEM